MEEEDIGSANEDDLFPTLYSKKGAKLVRMQDNSRIVNLRSWSDGPTTQTYPPTKTIDEQFPDKHWLMPGVVQEYVKENAWRNTSEEMKKKDGLWEERLASLRKSAEVHRQVRKYAQSIMKPGIKMIDLCKRIETTLRFILQRDGLDGGQAFPTGCSLNHIAAHYTPNYGDETVLSRIRSRRTGRRVQDRFRHSYQWTPHRLCLHCGLRTQIRKPTESHARCHLHWNQSCWY